MTETIGRGEAAQMDAAGIVRRGEASGLLSVSAKLHPGEDLPCCVGSPSGTGEALCEGPSVMEVYGIPMCASHGEEAAQGALEELYQDADQELKRFLSPDARSLNPEVVRALEAAIKDLGKGGPDSLDYDAVLLRAWPLDRSRVDAETVFQIENPEAYRGQEHPLDTFMRHRHLICRLMRLAHGEGAAYIVEALEPYRVEASAQAAYAVALEDAREEDGNREEARA